MEFAPVHASNWVIPTSLGMLWIRVVVYPCKQIRGWITRMHEGLDVSPASFPRISATAVLHLVHGSLLVIRSKIQVCRICLDCKTASTTGSR
jgi:hypothetical protein